MCKKQKPLEPNSAAKISFKAGESLDKKPGRSPGAELHS